MCALCMFGGGVSVFGQCFCVHVEAAVIECVSRWVDIK